MASADSSEGESVPAAIDPASDEKIKSAMNIFGGKIIK
jgi:hypothetical protein